MEDVMTVLQCETNWFLDRDALVQLARFFAGKEDFSGKRQIVMNERTAMLSFGALPSEI